MRRRRASWTVALAVLFVAGCGGSQSTEADKGGGRSDRLVDFSKKPPYVNALDIDPATGDYLLTTNRGFWRIDPQTDAVAPMRGKVTANSRTATVGTFLELLSTGPGELVGSGHRDRQGTLLSFLGFIASQDGGRSSKVVSRLGEADLHKIVAKHGRLYAFDAVLGTLLITRDGGRTFTERFTPPQLIIDFEVDPGDPDHFLASSDERLFRSEDGGERLRAIQTGEGIRLAWPAADALYRAEKDGSVQRSRDGGDGWERVGRAPGEPYKFKATGSERLLLALSDGTVAATSDGGRSWSEVFEP